MTLLSLLFDDDVEDGVVSSLYQVGPYVVHIRQRPTEGSVKAEGYEDLDPEASSLVAGTTGCASGSGAADEGGYTSNTPNVGLLVWSSSFVLGDYLFRHPPTPAGWAGVRVLELGAGTGVLGIALAMAGARVMVTDLPHIVPLAEENAGLNRAAMPDGAEVRVAAYRWGDDASALGDRFDAVVAADCVYERQYYGALLLALGKVCRPDTMIAMCYRKRKLCEEAFEAAAAAVGLELRHVPQGELGEEYREDGGYRVLRLRLPPGGLPEPLPPL